MKNKIIILTTIFLTISCYKEKEEKSYQDSTNTLKQKTEKIIRNTKEKTYKNSEVSLYNLNKIDTTITIYYTTGKPRYIQNYNILGDLTGKWTNYYKNGQIKQEGYYSNGQANGNWKYYNEDGNLKNEEFIKLDTNCVKFVALWDSQTIADEIGESKRWVFRNYTVDVWDKNTSNKEKNKITKLRASSYAELLGFNGEDYLIKAPIDKKIGWINKKHVKTFSMKNRVTRKLCD